MPHRLHLQFALTRRPGAEPPSRWPPGRPVAEAWAEIDGHYGRAAAQMPQVLAETAVVLAPEPPLPPGCAPVGHAELRLVAGALGDAVLLLSVDVDGPVEPLMETLRRLRDSAAGHVVRFDHAGQDHAGDDPAAAALTPLEAIAAAAGEALVRALDGWQTSDIGTGHVVELDADQVPVLQAPIGQREPPPGVPRDVDAALVARILYYDALPFREAPLRTAFAGVEYPSSTNRYGGTLAAVGPNGALLTGFSERFSRAMVLSHLLVRGVRLRAESVRAEAYADLQALYEVERGVTAVMEKESRRTDEQALRGMRTALSELSERCGSHRVALAFGAEAMLDIEVIVPSSLVGHYHRSVVSVARVAEMVATATLLVERLESAVSALRIVVETAEREADERRNAHLAKVGGILAAVGLVLTFVFGFYGSNVQPIGDRPPIASSEGYLLFFAIGLVLIYALAAATLRDPWLRLGRLGRDRLRRPGG